MADLVLEPRGPFSLAAAGRFLAEFPPADSWMTRRPPDEASLDGERAGSSRGAHPDGTVRLGFVRDDFSGVAKVTLRQAHEDGPVEVEVDGDGDVGPQLERILGLEHDGDAFVAVLDGDPVLRTLWERTGHLRQVSFPSPYEAACWSVIALRLRQPQAVQVRRRIEAAIGDGAFPVPERLAGLEPVEGLSEAKAERLRAMARAALDGRLDPYELRALPQDEAIARLRELPGLGPFYASLVLLRATGATDAFFPIERLRHAAARAYDLPEAPSEEAFTAMAERWRPFRSWACVLLRAGERAR